MRRYEHDEECPTPDEEEAERMFSRRCGLVLVGIFLMVVISGVLGWFDAKSATTNVYWRVDLNQGTSIIAYGQGATEQAAWEDCFRLQAVTRAMTAAETRRNAVSAVSGTVVRWCQNPKRYANVAPDPITPPAPSTPGLISWQAPTRNDDGSALTDLAYYLVNYGSSADAQIRAVRIPAAQRTFQMPAGTWYCSVRAVNSTDSIGQPSATIQVRL